MGNLECPQCGNSLANGVAVCGACGTEVKDNEVKDDEGALPPQEKRPGRKNVREKRIEKDLLIAKLVAKGTQGKGMTQQAWIGELNKRAKVEIIAK